MGDVLHTWHILGVYRSLPCLHIVHIHPRRLQSQWPSHIQHSAMKSIILIFALSPLNLSFNCKVLTGWQTDTILLLNRTVRSQQCLSARVILLVSIKWEWNFIKIADFSINHSCLQHCFILKQVAAAYFSISSFLSIDILIYSVVEAEVMRDWGQKVGVKKLCAKRCTILRRDG